MVKTKFKNSNKGKQKIKKNKIRGKPNKGKPKLVKTKIGLNQNRGKQK